MKNLKQVTIFLTAMAVSVSIAFAASVFDPKDQPLGYIAAAAVSSADIEDGAIAYLPKLDVTDFSGDLIAADFLANGAVNLLAPNWSFAAQLDAQHWDTGRYIVTLDKDDEIVPFRKDDMDGDAVKLFQNDETDRINYLRGDRSLEGDKFRERNTVLSSLVHSNPVYVGPPRNSYLFDDYEAFKTSWANRAGRVYVGSNTGMLHAIDAVTGNELFAYVPRPVYARMQPIAEPGDAPLSYSVDGTITVEDAYFYSTWHTVLVSGLGAGGMGVFALDVTSDAAISNESNLAGGAGQKFLWEFNRDNNDSDNLGYTYSRPSIVKLSNGVWAAVIGNGYMSKDGRASLFILDIRDGSIIKEIIVPDDDDNGLSSPTLIDIDRDGMVDSAYAGDLNGNIWKFNLTGSDIVGWQVAYSNLPLFKATTLDGMTAQPISTAVSVGKHPEGGVMIYAATGRLLSQSDASDSTEQAVYAIRDEVSDILDLPYGNSDLLKQTVATTTHPSSVDEVRTATDAQPVWTTHKGWRTSLTVAGSDIGERIIQNISLRNGRVTVSSMNPGGNGANWLMLLDAASGGAPDEIVFDVNKDGEFSVADNVDGNGDDAIGEVPVDRVMGLYKGVGLASNASAARIDRANESLIVNQIISIAPTYTPPTGGGDVGTDDYGLVGGHMDLDVSSQTYPIDGGATDNHDHEWDNDWGNVVPFFEIDSMGGFREVDGSEDQPGSAPSSPFIVSLANAGLSPGGILEINGVDFPVRVWQAKVKRYLSGTLAPLEWFPVFILNEPSPAQELRGIVQLTSLKMKFFADAILVGGLHPTQTGCIKGNEPAPNGEYRNGALTTQLLDASGVVPTAGNKGAMTPVNNAVTGAYEGTSFAIHNSLNYAMPPTGKTHGDFDGLHWESTLFWHWGGGCYTVSNADSYAEEWATEVGPPDDRAHDSEPGTGSFYDPFIDPDPDAIPDPDDDGDTTEEINEHNADNTQIPSLLNSGRLFWREWVPDND